MLVHNFTREVLQVLDKKIKKINGDFADYAVFCKDTLKSLRSSQKFIAPNGGRFLDTKFKSLPEFLNLPYPVTAIEYGFETEISSLAEQYLGLSNTVSCKKRIALAIQRSDHVIDVFSIYGSDTETGNGKTEWSICPYYGTIYGKDSKYVKQHALTKPETVDTSVPPNYLEDFYIEYKCAGDSFKKLHPDWLNRAFIDLQDEMLSVMNLVEVLACSNISTETVKPKRRFPAVMRTGALPYDDYHVLIVENKDKRTETDSEGANTQRSPREHLRRGHIRRYVNKSIFVQPCVVNAGKGGVIRKDYLLQP